jgi:hypothetical protein
MQLYPPLFLLLTSIEANKIKSCSKLNHAGSFVEGEATLQNPLPTFEMGYEGAYQRVKRMSNFEATRPLFTKKRKIVKYNMSDEYFEQYVATPLFEDP